MLEFFKKIAYELDRILSKRCPDTLQGVSVNAIPGGFQVIVFLSDIVDRKYVPSVFRGQKIRVEEAEPARFAINPKK